MFVEGDAIDEKKRDSTALFGAVMHMLNLRDYSMLIVLG